MMNVVISRIPNQLDIRLSRDGQELTNRSLVRQSSTTEPNGVGCGFCTNAPARLALSPR